MTIEERAKCAGVDPKTLDGLKKGMKIHGLGNCMPPPQCLS